MKPERVLLTMAASAAMVVAGGASAQAWTWASSGNAIKMTGGKGYGTATGVNEGKLTSTLADTDRDGQRIFVDLYGYTYGGVGHQLKWVASQSGRRSDGGSSYARMADKTFYPGYGDLREYNFTVRLCRDKPFAVDPCSQDTRTSHAL